jgi:hypothetical protein
MRINGPNLAWFATLSGRQIVRQHSAILWLDFSPAFRARPEVSSVFKISDTSAGLHLSVSGAFLFRILRRQRQNMAAKPSFNHERIQIKRILFARANRVRVRNGLHEG